MPALDELRTMALPYWARPGFMSMADPDDGGDPDDLDDEPDDPEDDPDDDPDADKSDEELRAELKEVRKQLSGANDKGKRNRLKARELQKQLDERGREKAKPKSDDDDKVDPAEVRRQALADARSESDSRIKKGAVRAELRAAGISTEQLARVAGMVNLDDLDVDDNGEVDGIDEAVADLKSEFPQLFGLESGKRRRPGVTGPSDEQRGGGKRKLSVDQQLANQLLGKR